MFVFFLVWTLTSTGWTSLVPALKMIWLAVYSLAFSGDKVHVNVRLEPSTTCGSSGLISAQKNSQLQLFQMKTAKWLLCRFQDEHFQAIWRSKQIPFEITLNASKKGSFNIFFQWLLLCTKTQAIWILAPGRVYQKPARHPRVLRGGSEAWSHLDTRVTSVYSALGFYTANQLPGWFGKPYAIPGRTAVTKPLAFEN